MTKKEAFLKKLLETFRVEAEEHLQALSAGLLALEKASEQEARMAIVETVFREAHSMNLR
jgi:two-component system, chemotaxis family, sensor kinase CheA